MAGIGHHLLVCAGCGRGQADDGLVLYCPYCAESSLLRTRYMLGRPNFGQHSSGMFRYADWLPVRREIPGSCRPLVYRSEGLAARLGLTDLWIAFSGYWPERGCHMVSSSFKELEAYCVLARTPVSAGIMVVASAGNTAAAFLAAGRRAPGTACALVVPERTLPDLATVAAIAGPSSGNTQVIALRDGTYNDAIRLSRDLVAECPSAFAEGGVRNVARRDGLAVVALTAFERAGGSCRTTTFRPSAAAPEPSPPSKPAGASAIAASHPDGFPGSICVRTQNSHRSIRPGTHWGRPRCRWAGRASRLTTCTHGNSSKPPRRSPCAGACETFSTAAMGQSTPPVMTKPPAPPPCSNRTRAPTSRPPPRSPWLA